MDEIAELSAIRQGIGHLVTMADGFPPLYSLALYAWVAVTGTVESSRWLSVLLGLLAIPVIYLWGRVLAGRSAGELAALLLAISPIHVWYSQEARAYALFFLLAVTALWRYEVARRTDRPRDWVWYAAPVVAGMYTHYYFGFVLIGIVASEAIASRNRPRLARWLQVHAAIGVLVAPLLLLLRADLPGQAGWLTVKQAPDLKAVGYTGFTLLTGFSLGPSVRELHTMRALDAIREGLPWVLLATVPAGYLLLRGWSTPTRREAWWRLVLLLAAAVTACVIATWLLDMGYRVRYLVWCAGPLVMLLAMGMARVSSRWTTLTAFGLLALLSGLAIANRHTVGRYMNEDARGAANMVERLSDASTPIFVVSGYMAEPINHYLGGRRTLTPLHSSETRQSPESGIRTIRTAVLSESPFLLLYSRPFDGDPQGRILDELESKAALQLIEEVPGIQVYRGMGW
jgi:uncharacterized membrane protein